MKKYIIIITAALLALTGCQKETTVDPVVEGEEVLFSGGAQTRTSLGDTGGSPIPVYWTTGDAIGVYAKAGATASNAKAVLTVGSGGQDGTFSSYGVKMAATGNEFYIYYPYVGGTITGGDPTEASPVRFVAGATPAIRGIVPAVQSQPAPDAFDQFGKYDYAVAVSSPVDKGQAVPFTMKHVLSYLELSLYAASGLDQYGIEKIEVEAENTNLAGYFKSTFDGIGEAETGASAVFGKKVTLNVGAVQAITNAAGNAQKFLVAMLSVDLSGEKVTVTVTLKDQSLSQTKIFKKVFTGQEFASGGLLKIFEQDLVQWSVVTSVSTGLEAFMTNLAALEQMAVEYAAANPPQFPSYYVNRYSQWLVTSYFRYLGNYYGPANEFLNPWNTAMGKLVDGFITKVKDNTTLHNYFNANKTIPGIDPDMYGGLSILTNDIRHMQAVVGALIYTGTSLDVLSGWGGDLVQFVVYLRKNKTGSTVSEWKNHAKTNMGKSGTYFDMSDVIADIDAIVINDLIQKQNMSIMEAFNWYYSNIEGYLKRFTLFKNSFSSSEVFYNEVKKITKPTSNSQLFPVNQLYKREGIADTNVITEEQGEGIAQGFIEFIDELAAME